MEGSEVREGAADPSGTRTRGLSRRAMLGWLGAAAVGAGLGTGGLELAWHAGRSTTASGSGDVVPFFGAHQAGIVTLPPEHLLFASFDVTARRRSDLHDLMRAWTDAAARMTAGKALAGSSTALDRPPADTGETLGASPSALTVTVGFGPTLFELDGQDRFGLAASRPAPLRGLPSFSNERLDPARSGGDICLQACSEDSLWAFHAIHDLARLARGVADLRWLQRGFGQASAVGANQPTPRNLMGFNDGTDNIRDDDTATLDRSVWVDDGPAWMRGGTFAVTRRIRIHLEKWDASDLSEQQDVFGRYKASGAPFGEHGEFDPVPLTARRPNGKPVIPADAHIRLASPASNGGEHILRRGYSFADGIDEQGLLDVGLFFVAFQRDPFRQFVRINRRLAAQDALNEYIVHTSSGVWAIPRGVGPGEYLGQGLL